jgi:hypothetical protein
VLEIIQNEGGFEIKTDILTGKRVVRHDHVIGHWPVLSTKYTPASRLGFAYTLITLMTSSDDTDAGEQLLNVLWIHIYRWMEASRLLIK